MTYQETLTIVRKQNPSMSFKDAQQKAKGLYDAYKNGQAELIKQQEQANPGSTKGGPKVKKLPGTIPTSDLYEAEKAIKGGPIDVSKIMNIGQQFIPDGKIVRHGKSENCVNTLVTFEDEAGNRLPQEGFYEIFL